MEGVPSAHRFESADVLVGEARRMCPGQGLTIIPAALFQVLGRQSCVPTLARAFLRIGGPCELGQVRGECSGVATTIGRHGSFTLFRSVKRRAHATRRTRGRRAAAARGLGRDCSNNLVIATVYLSVTTKRGMVYACCTYEAVLLSVDRKNFRLRKNGETSVYLRARWLGVLSEAVVGDSDFLVRVGRVGGVVTDVRRPRFSANRLPVGGRR